MAMPPNGTTKVIWGLLRSRSGYAWRGAGPMKPASCSPEIEGKGKWPSWGHRDYLLYSGNVAA
jgi:hypothetical protein